MPWSLLNLHLLLPGFALVLFRVAGLMVTAPMFSSQAIPARFRIACALAAAAVLFPLVAPTIAADVTLTTALAGVVGEMLIGLIIGLGVTIVLVGVQLAGMMIGQQAGIALASVVDPSQGFQSTVVGQVFAYQRPGYQLTKINNLYPLKRFIQLSLATLFNGRSRIVLYLP